MRSLETPMTGQKPARAWRAEFIGTVTLAWPLVLMQLAQIGINTTEVLLVGRLGAVPLAGAALATSSFHTIFLFSLGLAVAVAPLVAQARGAREFRTIRRAVRQGLWATTLVALPGMLLLWYLKPILLWAGQDPQAAAYAEDFARPLSFGLAPWLWFFVIRNFMAAMDRPRPALYVMTAAILLNAGFGYALIFGHFGLPALGVTGAGIVAGLVGWFLPLALLLFVRADRQLRRFHILGRLWRPDWQLLREVFRIGLPIGFALLFETTMFMAALYLQGLISTNAQAAHIVAMQLAAIAFMVPLGLSQAATVRVGLAAGRRDAAGVAVACDMAFLLGVLCTLAAAALFVLLPEPLIGAFLDNAAPETPAVVALGITFLAIAGLFQLVDGAQVIAMGCLRGFKDTRVPMLIAGFGYWLVGLPVALLLGFWLGLEGLGIWIGMAVGLAVAAGLLVLRLRRQVRRLHAAWAPGPWPAAGAAGIVEPCPAAK